MTGNPLRDKRTQPQNTRTTRPRANPILKPFEALDDAEALSAINRRAAPGAGAAMPAEVSP
jgi:hypothetical protein